MASKKRERKDPAPSVAPASEIWDRLASPQTVFLGLAAAVLLFYYKPLFSANASIQWDAVDVQYSAQNHLSEMLRAGRLPQWTPYVFSGMPFLADPQLGAWYPLNWPFSLAGMTPRAIEWQLALHCLLAAMGGYLLDAIFCAAARRRCLRASSSHSRGCLRHTARTREFFRQRAWCRGCCGRGVGRRTQRSGYRCLG